jgi:hypothetical protein
VLKRQRRSPELMEETVLVGIIAQESAQPSAGI